MWSCRRDTGKVCTRGVTNRVSVAAGVATGARLATAVVKAGPQWWWHSCTLLQWARRTGLTHPLLIPLLLCTSEVILPKQSLTLEMKGNVKKNFASDSYKAELSSYPHPPASPSVHAYISPALSLT